jgi:hypothetical protein
MAFVAIAATGGGRYATTKNRQTNIKAESPAKACRRRYATPASARGCEQKTERCKHDGYRSTCRRDHRSSGISDRGVVAPVTGIVTRIHAYPGDTIAPYSLLFS